MQKGWISKAGSYTVEHVPCPDYAGNVDESAPAKGVLHTTEGSGIEGALAVFKQHYAPHFLVGRDTKGKVRILQLLPLGRAAAALEHKTTPTNSVARVQIEIVGFSKAARWLPDHEVSKALAALLGVLRLVAGISLIYFPNHTRDTLVWTSRSGWFGHSGVPGNTHWDPGALDVNALFGMVATRSPVVVKPKPTKTILRPRTWTLVRRANGLVEAVEIDRPR